MIRNLETIEGWLLLIGVRCGWTRAETLALPLRRLKKTVALLVRKQNPNG